MVAITGRFDGKVIVPDKPVDLPANQRVLIHIQPVEERKVDYHSWIGLANRGPANPDPRFRTHDDLWG